jgi:hypothetical protein
MRILLLALLMSCAQQKFAPVPTPTAPTLTPTQECSLQISTPGVYTLDHDVYSDTCGIEIRYSDVKLNLNGHTITGPKSNTKVSYGIKSLGWSNVEIYNGVVDGFMYGVVNKGNQADSSDSHDNSVHHTIIKNSSSKGLQIGGYRAKAFNNTITNTGGTTYNPSNWNFGIEVVGADCDVSFNTVTETYRTPEDGATPSEAVGICFSHFNSFCKAEGNIITNSLPANDKSTFGFWVEAYTIMTLKNNYVRNMHYSGIMKLQYMTLEGNDLDVPFASEMTDRFNDPYYNFNH